MTDTADDMLNMYRAHATDAPRAAVDDKVLGMARAALRTDARARRLRWALPALALAASALLWTGMHAMPARPDTPLAPLAGVDEGQATSYLLTTDLEAASEPGAVTPPLH